MTRSCRPSVVLRTTVTLRCISRPRCDAAGRLLTLQTAFGGCRPLPEHDSKRFMTVYNLTLLQKVLSLFQRCCLPSDSVQFSIIAAEVLIEAFNPPLGRQTRGLSLFKLRDLLLSWVSFMKRRRQDQKDFSREPTRPPAPGSLDGLDAVCPSVRPLIQIQLALPQPGHPSEPRPPPPPGRSQTRWDPESLRRAPSLSWDLFSLFIGPL